MVYDTRGAVLGCFMSKYIFDKFLDFLQKNCKTVYVSIIYAPKIIFELREEYANARYFNFIIQQNVRKYVDLWRIPPDY